jgi:hypothetical protein
VNLATATVQELLGDYLDGIGAAILTIPAASVAEPKRLSVFGERDIDRHLRHLLTDERFGIWLFAGSSCRRREDLFWYLDREINPCNASIQDCDQAMQDQEEAAAQEPGRSAIDEHAQVYREYQLLVGQWLSTELSARLHRRVEANEIPHVCDDIPGLAPPESPGVYAILGAGGFIKIGKARRSIRSRFAELQCAHPVKLSLLAVLSTNPNQEGEFHKRFADARVQGEWFKVTPALRTGIRKARGLRK